MIKLYLFIVMWAGFILPHSLFAGDLEAGKAIAQKSCAVCHGLDGQATVPLAAHISGQQKDYLIIQLRAYRSGKRHHDQMSIIAKPLSNDDINNLAEWYSSIKVIVANLGQTDEAESSNEPSLNANITEESPKPNNDQKNSMDDEVIKLIEKRLQSFIK